ncbi:Glycosyl hydrolase family 20, catalytic domain [Pedobacter sp. ok626]|uniref:family 20 glycosylhydrolase n=1 Tax=Pedobacter sp. ok626 TaxID=1761882 RepID=UPI0008924212|nr:family 20 glycosylhydrolase [Pedobacter sp. ok626]SDJ06059.1 Glycosyl hydrolase family 20, catalytic domain [Pedobacter sp. ok626]
MKIKVFFLMLLSTFFLQAKAFQKEISDPVSPFPVRGFHLDLRIQAIPMPALKKLALQLVKGGINTLVMEWEGTYPFQEEPLIANRFAYTRDEVKAFIAYCGTINLDVIPLQQSFGHVEYILRNPKYKDLREDQKDYSQVNPIREAEAKKLFITLYKDLISTHHSPYIHIGGDETYLLGHSEESKKKIKAVGIGRLYGDYIKMLCDVVVGLGKRPVLWADIALKYPEALKGLPKETIFIDWNYGWDINMFGDHQKLMQSGFEIWGAPSIRSHPDNYFLSQWAKHFKNITDFVPMAKELGYKGIVMTSWSTSGLYSPVFETTRDIIDLYAIRRVYPISGFNMLIAAFLESIKTAKPLDADIFINSYAQLQYGLSKNDARKFWKAISTVPYEITQGKPINTELSIDQMLDSTRNALSILGKLKPVKNVTEFEHYRLMAAIRVQYLSYQSIESRANAAGMTAEQLKPLITELEALHTKELDKKFIALNSAVMYPAEMAQENELRNGKIQVLLQRLKRLR